MINVSSEQYQLDNDTTISYIEEQKIKNPDLNIGLFIGKNSQEELPIEEGWLWISLNNEPAKTPFVTGRVHLEIDFTNLESLEKIKNTFDEVVLDLSTKKFLGNCKKDFLTRMTDLLKKGIDSRLIVDAEIGMIDSSADCSEIDFTDYIVYRIPTKKTLARKNKTQIDYPTKNNTDAKLRLLHHALTLFHKAELFQKKRGYHYPFSHWNKPFLPYIICTNPK